MGVMLMSLVFFRTVRCRTDRSAGRCTHRRTRRAAYNRASTRANRGTCSGVSAASCDQTREE